MLTKLSIQNYALIEDISIDFSDDLTTISGETGAGKSILLGGLGLILGKRATTASLMNPEKKCIIEGEFDIAPYKLRPFFEQNDIDYDTHTIIRRELLTSGKSRAFINDTPVGLSLLTDLKNSLIDVHSQHQTLRLNDTKFQFSIIDSFANTKVPITHFKEKLEQYTELNTAFEILKERIQKEAAQHDYHSFLFEELELAGFKSGDQEILELELERLNNVELIKLNLNESYELLSKSELGIIDNLHQVRTNLNKIKNFSKAYEHLFERVESLYIEIKDIETELESNSEIESLDVNSLEKLNDGLQLLYNLYQKHKVDSIEDLLIIKEELSEKVNRVTNAEALLSKKENKIKACQEELIALGKEISAKRRKAAPILENELAHIVHELGMPHARFGIRIEESKFFFKNGIDNLFFQFSANKGGKLGSLKQIASGGEMSRIMLAVKSVMASKSQLPTIIFDEIDAGISGEIAIKMADIMQKMATNMQVVAITHLPQIVARGRQHLKVYKYTEHNQTNTEIKLLNKDERVQEIAEMLGGKTITESAVNHAKQLLK